MLQGKNDVVSFSWDPVCWCPSSFQHPRPRLIDVTRVFLRRGYYICIYGCWSKFLYGHSSRIKIFTFAKLSRTPCLSFAGPMLANNTSYEDSFTTCQIAPENHGSLLGSLLNMQLASRSPFSGQVFFAKFTGSPPSTCTLTFARSFA